MTANTMQQGAQIQQYQLQIEALRAAIKALKDAKGSELHIAALEQLIQAQEQEVKTASESYMKALRAVRDIMLTAPHAHDSQSPK